MFSRILLLLLLIKLGASGEEDSFTYNGFLNSNMSLEGIAEIMPNGLLRLTNDTNLWEKAHAFHSIPLHFKNTSNGNTHSFSTVFAFAIVPKYPSTNSHGMAFFISPSGALPTSLSTQYLGLFNLTNIGHSSNHVVAVELDTGPNTEFGDINGNHVGIDINSLISTKSSPAAYFSNENGGVNNISLVSGKVMLVWVEYNGLEKQFNVTISPIEIPKPILPLLSLNIDLSSILFETMYVGFSSGTGTFRASHYVLGWSFNMNGDAKALDLSHLPSLPRTGTKEKSKVLTIGLPLISAFLVLTAISIVILIVRRKIKFAELLEEWERGPHRFSYRDLSIATKGFGDTECLGIGGFGRVYKGILPNSEIEIAVKKVSHDSRQGVKEFVAEIVSLGQIRHRNLVQLLGYCRRKGELLLVYEFMCNGSLDKFLFGQPKTLLNWAQRFRIVKGVASGLLYLHQEWDQVVIHRDVKASNVLLGGEFNGKLGDFGLARLYDHGTDPRTTRVVGTLGYIAPELSRTGKACTRTDVFSFGVFMLEVACGRRPISLRADPEQPTLVDWVLQSWRKGEILEVSDPKLGNEYVVEEMELVLKLGLRCSHPMPEARPSMRQVVQILNGCSLLELSSDGLNGSLLSQGKNKSCIGHGLSHPSSDNTFVATSSMAESLLFSGR